MAEYCPSLRTRTEASQHVLGLLRGGVGIELNRCSWYLHPSDRAWALSMHHHQFNSFWYGNELSAVEWVCLKSFIEHGHKIRLFCYNPIKVPHGVSVVDASEITARDEIFLFKGSVTAFANLFRYKLVLKYGEWWVDTDVYCLTDDIPECRYAWAHQDAELINNAILKFPPNDPVLHEINSAAHRIGRNIKVWGESGPCLLTKYLAASGCDDHFGKREEFYPIHWLETFLFWLPDYSDIIQDRCRGSFVHLWTSVFPQIGIDRYTQPPSGSFLERIYAPHIGELHLEELSPQKYNRTIESIKAYCQLQAGNVARSVGALGYDVSKFPFDGYI
jgi:hypothetical protein